MQTRIENETPHVTAEAQLSNEIVTRIRKLHWIGNEEETARLAQFLAQMPHSATLLGPPLDTD